MAGVWVKLPCQHVVLFCAQVRNEKAKRFLMNMRRKPGVQLENYFPRADRGAVALLKRMLVSFGPDLLPCIALCLHTAA